MFEPEVNPGRCRCGRRIDEDGEACQWHTAVQAQILRELVDLANMAARGGAVAIPSHSLREVLEKGRG